MKGELIILTASIALATATAASQQRVTRSTIHKLDELTAPQVAGLDRERTMFILPVGMLEQHGPHLPIGADTLAVVYEANGAARRTRASRSSADHSWSATIETTCWARTSRGLRGIRMASI